MDSERRSRPNVLSLLFSPRGTIGRGEFVGGAALLAATACATDGIILSVADDLGLVGFGFALLVAWSGGVLSRKRLHDLGWSGLTIAVFLGSYILTVLISPFIAVWLPGAAILHPFLLVTLMCGPAIGWLVWLVITPGTLAYTAEVTAARLALHASSQPNAPA
jgi:uncharacterized membrane protein YhaH (DUF805 family)